MTSFCNRLISDDKIDFSVAPLHRKDRLAIKLEGERNIGCKAPDVPLPITPEWSPVFSTTGRNLFPFVITQ